MALPPFTITFDKAECIVRCTVRGFWSYGDAEAYFAKLEPLLRERRMTDGRVKALIDRRDSTVQSPEVSARMLATTKDMRENDRVARIASSALAAIQLRRIFHHPGDRVFTDLDEAVAWLKEA